jgi:hypothetical protein
MNEVIKNSNGVFWLKKRAPAVANSEYTITWQPRISVAGGYAAGVRVKS